VEGARPEREILAAGAWRVAGSGCSFVFRRLRPGLLHVTVAGHDTGQLGSVPLDEIRAELDRHAPLDLFIDARDGLATSTAVIDEWREFFRRRRDALSRVRILVGSRYMQLTVGIAQHLSGTRDLLRIDTEAEAFAAALADASARG
jgi:hypothetical protein